jgi:UDP-N-acetylglucosamine diphosphorylase/glucosamine-1-phosphate N-acetyltransferase
MLDGCRGPWPEAGTATLDAEGAVRMAVVDHAEASALLEAGELPQTVATSVTAGPPLAEAAWDVFTTAGDRIADDLDRLGSGWGSPPDPTAVGPIVLGDHPVRIAASATFDPGVVLDARAGAIAIGADVHVGINAAIHGPCAVLDSTRVADHTMLKVGTVIGPHCRVGGEIGGTVFQGFANKSHHGHLGDSWVGAWANLGAGTVNSNLLNTYGDVAMRLTPDGPRLRSGRQFLGCVIGDHAKTAIGTRIMTGTSIGTGAMIATSTPPAATVPAFTWATDAGTRSYRFDKFLDVARKVMARREIVLDEAVEDRLRELHPEAGREVGS